LVQDVCSVPVCSVVFVCSMTTSYPGLIDQSISWKAGTIRWRNGRM
jgi:hypothetical protein